MDDGAWFIRHVGPTGRIKRGVTPLNWRGRAVLAGFVLAMTGGGALYLLIALLTGQVILGAVAFAVCAALGAGTFLWAAATRSRLVPFDAVADRAPVAWSIPRLLASLLSAVVGAVVVSAIVYVVSRDWTAAGVTCAIVLLAGSTTSIWAMRLSQTNASAGPQR